MPTKKTAKSSPSSLPGRQEHKILLELERLAHAIADEGRLTDRAWLDNVNPRERTALLALNRIVDALANPLGSVADCVEKLSRGIIPDKLETGYPGDLARTKNGLNLCFDQMNGFVAGMGHMSEEHNKGDIDVTIPADRFEGVFRSMARGANEMVASHITVKKKAMACVDEFSKGNFEASLELFPGKKSFINDAIERLRGNIKDLLAEMKRMSEEHNRGEIDVMILAERFEGAFRTVARGVNEMVAGHIAVKRKAMACVEEFSKGNFEASLEQFAGKKAFIERLRDNVMRFIQGMNRMSDEHNKGDIDVMIPDERFEGAFRTMARGVNDMVSGHISVKKKTMACIAEFGRGNFEPPLERGPFLHGTESAQW